MFRKRFPRMSRSRPEHPALRESPEPVAAAALAEPIEPAPEPSPLKDIVAPRRPGAGGRARSSGRTLVVGLDIVLTGEIAACETLIIEGRVEGKISETQRLEIAETGRFKGRAEVQECVVEGACEGELTVAGPLAIRAKGRVTGAVRYVAIEIQRGGRLSGDIGIQAVREIASQTTVDAEAESAALSAPKPGEERAGLELAPGTGPRSS